jgi:hypothetical protein
MTPKNASLASFHTTSVENDRPGLTRDGNSSGDFEMQMLTGSIQAESSSPARCFVTSLLISAHA